jgi:hypothetical protein
MSRKFLYTGMNRDTLAESHTNWRLELPLKKSGIAPEISGRLVYSLYV